MCRQYCIAYIKICINAVLFDGLCKKDMQEDTGELLGASRLTGHLLRGGWSLRPCIKGGIALSISFTLQPIQSSCLDARSHHPWRTRKGPTCSTARRHPH